MNLAACLARGSRRRGAEEPVEAADLGDGGLLGVHGGEDGFADGFGVGVGGVGEEFDLRAVRACGDAAEGDVDAVGGGAAHDSSYDHRFVFLPLEDKWRARQNRGEAESRFQPIEGGTAWLMLSGHFTNLFGSRRVLSCKIFGYIQRTCPKFS